LCEVMGIDFSHEKSIEDKSLVEDLISLIIEIRQDVRLRKDWAASDKIRDSLARLNIKLKDTRDGTLWQFGGD